MHRDGTVVTNHPSARLSIVNPLFLPILLVGVLFSASSPLWSATTGSGPDDLITIQGGGSTCPQGDFYSTPTQSTCIDPSLDTYYSYWIEVPSGSTRLVVQIFDADIGLGGVNELHDRQRNGSWDTAVQYQLFDPNGTQAALASCDTVSCSGFNNNDTNNKWRRLGSAVNNPTPGLWELRIDQSSLVTTGDDINRLGINARDRLGRGATNFKELNIFYYSSNSGSDDVEGDPLTVTNYPYVTSGCILGENNFDFDGSGSAALTSRLGTVTNIANISGNGDWAPENVNVAGMDDSAEDYGIWTQNLSFNNGTGTANYGNWYLNPQGQSSGAPASRLALNDGRAFRIYLPSGFKTITGAPAKPYLAQWVSQTHAGNPNLFTITVRLINPTAHDITNIRIDGESATGSFVGVVAGFPTHGTFNAPTLGGTGPYDWTIPTLPAGENAVLAFNFDVAAPSMVTTVTGSVGSGNGTRASWDEFVAGNTYRTGEICELRIGPGLTEAVISRFEVKGGGGKGVVEWETASEVGTLGFFVERRDSAGGEFVRLNEKMIFGLGLSAPQGGRYRFEDAGVAVGEKHVYRLIEIEADGTERRYGPYRIVVGDAAAEQPAIDLRSRSARVSRGARAHPLKRRRLLFKSGVRALSAGTASTAYTAKSKAAGHPGGRAATAVKIGIREDGLYHLSAGDIAPLLGLSANEVKRRIRQGRLRLSHRDRDVAWRAGEGNDGLYFYAEGIDSIYTVDNVYWLRLGKGLRMATVNGGSPDPVSPAGSFTDEQHVEEDKIAVLVQPTPDYWYWDWLTNGDSKEFAFQLHAPAAGDARLTLQLQGFSESDHAIDVLMNGVSVGNVGWNGPIEQEVTLDFDAALLFDGDNSVTLSSGPAGSGSAGFVYLNGFDVRYPRRYEAAAEVLDFTAGGAAQPGAGRVVTVSGFGTDTIRLLDIRNPLHPRWIKNARIDAADGYRISFKPRGGEGSYFAVAAPAIKTPAWVRGDTVSRLRGYQNRADYVVIAPAEFTAGAQALADHQTAKGLKAIVVLLEDIYDAFNGGIEDPLAIQRFLEYAWNNWRIAPRYAALAGDGSYDHRDLLGSGDSLVPALLTATPDGLFAADNLYGRFGNEQKIAIGRIPAHDNAELRGYVEKLQSWEAGLDGSGLVQLAADDDDAAGAFTAASNALKGLIPADRLAAEDIYLQAFKAGNGGIDAARTALFDALDSGRDMVNYLGHGGVNRMAAEGLLTTADVAGLVNARPPVVYALSCVINRFELAGYDSLGEELLLHQGGGAIAVWSATGLSQNAGAALLNQALYERIFGTDGAQVQVLGDAIIRALNDDAALDGAQWMPKVYTLIGYPALPLAPGAHSERRRNPRPALGGSGD